MIRRIVLFSLTLLMTFSLTSLLGGCATGPQAMQPIYQSYDQGNYAQAYRQADELLGSVQGLTADHAAYMAGLSALQLGDLAKAEDHLSQAISSEDESLGADARASLGLVYYRQCRYGLSRDALLSAGKNLSGQEQANAYFHAARAQQNLGDWNGARVNLTLARQISNDSVFKQKATDQIAATGFTLQLGAFVNPANARQLQGKALQRPQAQKLSPPQIVMVPTIKGRHLYAVQIGQFSSYDNAAQARAALGPGYTSAIIVPLRNR